MRKAKTKKKGRLAWSKDEIKLLKRLFPRGRAKEVAEQTGRTLAAVKQRAYEIGLKTGKYRRWSPDEVKLLKRLHAKEKIQSIADKLGRSYKTVKGKAHSIGLKKQECRPWSRQEMALLKKMYPTNNKQEIANRLGRSVGSVVGRAHNSGISEQRDVWSKRELNLLKKLYPGKEAEQIAEQLGRPVQATRKKIVLLGLRKRFKYDERHRVVKGVKKKLCLKCRKWESENQYYRNRNSRDGLVEWCSKCMSAFHKKKRLAAKN